METGRDESAVACLWRRDLDDERVCPFRDTRLDEIETSDRAAVIVCNPDCPLTGRKSDRLQVIDPYRLTPRPSRARERSLVGMAKRCKHWPWVRGDSRNRHLADEVTSI
jgi:hypothetical protein